MKLTYTIEQDIEHCGCCRFLKYAEAFTPEDYCDIGGDTISFEEIPEDCPMRRVDNVAL